jgi:hypothetical protein
MSTLFLTRTRVIIHKYYIEVREEWVIPATFLLKCLYQIKKVSGHVFVCEGIDFDSFYDFDIDFGME